MTIESPAPAEVQPWTGGSWESLVQEADEVFGADLEKGAVLIGVPMCIIRVTFRQGDFTNASTKNAAWYVSMDTIIGPEADIERAMRRGRIPEEIRATVPDPGEHLVFNEGGTGAYRQIVAYLEAKGLIRINSDLPREGHYGESRYDVFPPEWDIREDLRAGSLTISDDGTRVVQFDIRLLCPRGLRASAYENEFTKQGVTRYIA
jgi:hypothetical protein